MAEPNIAEYSIYRLSVVILQIEQPWNNAVVVEDESHLHALWHFLDCILTVSCGSGGLRSRG